jgi:hypothetical protein
MIAQRREEVDRIRVHQPPPHRDRLPKRMVKVLLPRHDDLLREGHVHRRLVRTHTVLVDAREEVVVGRVQVKPLVSERAVELCLVLPLLVDRVFEAVVVGVRLIAAFIPSKA